MTRGTDFGALKVLIGLDSIGLDSIRLDSSEVYNPPSSLGSWAVSGSSVLGSCATDFGALRMNTRFLEAL